MRRLALVALVMAACSAQPSASTGTRPTPSPLSCQLPVISGSKGQGSGPQTAGFLSFPGVAFTAATDAGDGLFYDRPLKRWVLSGPPALSDNGLSYAYVTGDTKSSRLHLIDLASNRDVVVAEGGPWRLVGTQPDALYVMLVEYLPDSPAYGVMQVGRGLWKVPLVGGAPVQLTKDSRNWAFVSGGFAWGDGNTYDVAGGPNDVIRMDLQTKKAETWFAPGKRSRVVAIDSDGAPLIMSEAANAELWRVAAPKDAVNIWSDASGGLRPYFPFAVDHGVIWFSSSSLTPSWAIFRYSAAKGMELMASFSDHPVSVAGPCA
jgi:hypothetical protein